VEKLERGCEQKQSIVSLVPLVKSGPNLKMFKNP